MKRCDLNRTKAKFDHLELLEPLEGGLERAKKYLF
jgi:hypothetical protein